MKPRIRPFLALALPLCLPLASAARAQMTTWAQSYGVGSYDPNGRPLTTDAYGSGDDTTVDIVAMPDGGVVVAGQLDLPELHPGTVALSRPCMALVRYAADGHMLWQQILRQDNDGANTTARARRLNPPTGRISSSPSTPSAERHPWC